MQNAADLEIFLFFRIYVLFWERIFSFVPDDGVTDDEDSDSVIELNELSTWADIFDVLVAKSADENDISPKFVDDVELYDCALTLDLD